MKHGITEHTQNSRLSRWYPSHLPEAPKFRVLISQSPSESSISIVVKKNDLDKAVNTLEMELLGKMIKKIDVTTDVSIIALIGSGMRGTIGVASRVFSSVAKKRSNVMMIAQGSSELNLAFVVKDSDCAAAVSALHDEFKLASQN